MRDTARKLQPVETEGLEPLYDPGPVILSKIKILGYISLSSLVFAVISLAVVGVLTHNLSVIGKRLDKRLAQMARQVARNTDEDLVFFKVLHLKPSTDIEVARAIAAATTKYSKMYHQDPDLVLSIIKAESHFDPDAKSSMGARGLMQLMPGWKTVFNIQGDLYDIDTNIQHGIQVLGFYQQMYGELDVALSAYNRGPSRVDWDYTKEREPVNQYATKVLEIYEGLKKLSR